MEPAMAKESRDFKDILADPTGHFDRPSDVVEAPSLSREQKIEILNRWEADSRELMVATDEGMGGGEQNRLGEVHAALKQLGVEGDGDKSSTTMHGYHADE
jgi:hypothetical protein